MNFSFISLLICLNLISISYEQECTDAGMDKFDGDISVVLTVGNWNKTFPEKTSEMAPWCKQSRSHLVEIEKYNAKCTHNLFKRLISLYVYGFRRTTKLYCRPGSKLGSALMASSACWNKNKKTEVKCSTDFIDTLHGITNEPVQKKKIPFFCCEFYKWTNCFEERLTGQPHCDENKLTVMKQYLLSTTTNAIDLICGSYKDDSDKCNKLGDPPKKKASQKRAKSPAVPVGLLFDSISEY